jgi:hypothetical protein
MRVSCAEKAAAKIEELLDLPIRKDMMKNTMEYSDRMRVNTEKNRPIVGINLPTISSLHPSHVKKR